MIPEVRVFPIIEDVFACAELQCYFLEVVNLDSCEKQHCPFAHQRRREESAIEIATKDARMEEERRSD